MPELNSTMYLFHASYCEVTTPDLSKCAKYKDFGQGFYLTTSKEQAERFTRLSVRKAIDFHRISAPKYGVVNVFTCPDFSDLSIFDFPNADVSWLHCVVAHRRPRLFPEVVQKLQPYDVISGKVANDDTNATIIAYIDGLYGEAGTERADSICISLLLPERLQDQFCFRTQKAIKTLKFEGSERVWL